MNADVMKQYNQAQLAVISTVHRLSAEKKVEDKLREWFRKRNSFHYKQIEK